MDMGYAIGFSVEAEFGSMLEPAPAIITAGFGQSTENGEATGVFGDTCPFGEAYDGATMSVYDSNRYRDWETDRKSTRLNSSHSAKSRMPSSA